MLRSFLSGCGLVLALAGCSRTTEATRVDETGAAPSSVEAGPPTRTVVVAASIAERIEIGAPLSSRLAFADDGRWWHWDGQQAIGYREGRVDGPALSSDELLAQEPRAPSGRPWLFGSMLITDDRPRPMPAKVASVVRDDGSPYGGYEVVDTAWSDDGSQVVVARHWRPGRCCREREHSPPPRRDVIEIHDTVAGTTVETPGEPPLAIGPTRLVLGHELYVRNPLHPLDLLDADRPSLRGAAIDPTGSIVAWTNHDGTVELRRAEDGQPLRSWAGPEGASVVAFHPRHPLLAVAGFTRLELWRIDGPTPVRWADAPLTSTCAAIVFDPDGRRLFATGPQAVVFTLAFEERQTTEASALQSDLATAPSSVWQAGADVDALAMVNDRVYAYGRRRALVAFEGASGRRLGSWRRAHGHREAAAARRAPVFALVDQPHRDDPSVETQRLQLVDASTWLATTTRYIDRGSLAHLEISAKGTSFAWSIEDDPTVTLQHVADGTILQLHADTNHVAAVAISDDDRHLAIANRHVERNVRVGTVGSTDVAVMTTPRGVNRLLFSPDGERLYVVDFDARIHVLDWRRSTVVATFDPKLDSIEAMAITEDGTRLVLGRDAVAVIETSSGAEIRRFTDTGWARSLAVSEDGNTIVVGGSDGLVLRLRVAPP